MEHAWNTMITLLIIGLVFLPLGIWKLVEIIFSLLSHVKIV
jgi:hypothetical protein